jgi:hypothetical protein
MMQSNKKKDFFLSYKINFSSDYNVTRSRQNTMISYCHSLNLRVMMNAWDPDDVMSGTPMILNSQDFYLLESYLIEDNIYQNLTLWKIKVAIFCRK